MQLTKIIKINNYINLVALSKLIWWWYYFMNPLLFINILQSTILLQLFAHIYFVTAWTFTMLLYLTINFRGALFTRKWVNYLHIFTFLFISRPVYINLLFTFVKINLTTTRRIYYFRFMPLLMCCSRRYQVSQVCLPWAPPQPLSDFVTNSTVMVSPGTHLEKNHEFQLK